MNLPLKLRGLVWLVLILALGAGILALSSQLGEPDPAVPAEEVVTPTPIEEAEEPREDRARESEVDRRAVPLGDALGSAGTSVGGVRGQVLNVREGKVVPAAEINVDLVIPGADHKVVTTTDREGRFSFSPTSLPEEARVLRVRTRESDDYQRAAQSLPFRGKDATYPEVELRRLAFAPLEGVVVDDEGRGLPGVTITMGRRLETWSTVEVFSGLDGRFSIKETRGLRGAANATLDGYVLLHGNRLEAHADGGWNPLHLVMTRSAALAVALVGPDGGPVVDAAVSLRIAVSEKLGAEEGLMWADGHEADGTRQLDFSKLRRPVPQRTGVDGIARFDPTWSDRRLEVLAPGDVRLTHVDTSDHLVGESAPGARPLILEPGQVRQVECPLGTRLRVEGTVTDTAGSPCENQYVLVSSLTREGEVRRTEREKTDEEGRYDCEAIDLEPGDLVYVHTKDGNPYRNDPASIENIGAVTADPAEAVEGTLTVDLAMRPALSLSGRVLDETEEPVLAWCEAVRETDSTSSDRRPKRAGSTEGLGSEFLIGGLEPGTYELHVHERLPGVQSKHVFPGLVAGSEGLELRITTPANASIKIRAAASGVELARCVALIDPLDPSLATRASATVPKVLTDPSLWPLEAPIDTSGNIGSLFLVAASESSEHEWSRVRPGLYRVGIQAWDGDGQPLYPMATGPVEFGPGAHEIVAPLRPVGSFGGRVTGGDSAAVLALALVDGRGSLLPLFPDGNHAVDVLPVDAKGEFQVAVAPAGDLTLIVGSEGELRAGQPRLRMPITIQPGEHSPVEIEL